MPTPCQASPDLWFSEHPDDSEAAKDACLDCPVMFGCAEKGLSEEHGVWGGLDPADRGAVLERRFGPALRRPPRRQAARRVRRHCSEEQCSTMRELLTAGMSYGKVATEVCLPKHVVVTWWRKQQTAQVA